MLYVALIVSAGAILLLLLARKSPLISPARPNRFSTTAVSEGGGNIEACRKNVTINAQAESQPTRQEREFLLLVEDSPDFIARYDRAGCRIYTNSAFNRLASKAYPGQTTWLTHEYCSFDYLNKIQEVLESGVENEIECDWVDSAGKSLASLVRLIPERNAAGNITGVLSIGRDISDLKETERRLRQSRALLRDLTARHELEERKVRKELAQKMHEEYGQQLSALRLNLALMKSSVGTTLPGLERMLAESMTLLDGTISQMRTMATILHPSVLNMGISVALEWLADEYLSTTEINYEVHVDVALENLGESETLQVFRIVQLALSNVVQHASARNVSISLMPRDDGYQLEICDDGKGFDLDHSRGGALGLVAMEELSHAVAGEIVFLSQPGKGTKIEVFFPAPTIQRTLFGIV